MSREQGRPSCEEKREQDEDTSQKKVQINSEQREQEHQEREITFAKQDEQEGERPDSDCEEVGEEAEGRVRNCWRIVSTC